MRSRFANAFALLLGLTCAVCGQTGTPVLPVVTGCVRSQGSGSTLAITAFGTGFLPDATLRWNGSPLTTTRVSDTQLTASVPAGLGTAAGSATVSVVSSGIVSNCVSISVLPSLLIASVSPSRMDAGGPAFTVTILGAGFLPGSVAMWARTPLATTVQNSGQLSALVPASLSAFSGAFNLTVVIPGGAVSNAFGMIVQPVLTAVSPNFAAVGRPGITITATGAGFVSTDVLAITQPTGRTNLPTAFVSAATLTAVLPPSALTLAFQSTIQVFDTVGEISSRGVPFTIGQPPVIASLSPDSATTGAPGFALAVGGSRFLSGAVVQWNGVPLPTTFVNGTRLTASVAAALIASQGSAGISVTVPGGLSNTVAFAIRLPAPLTASGGVVNAASGLPSIAPGSLISIYGTNLASGSGAAEDIPLPTVLKGTSVAISGVLAPLLFAGSTRINAQVPFETPVGKATLVVEVAGQRSVEETFVVTATGPGVVMDPVTKHAIAENSSDSSLNSPGNPAQPGQYVVVYLTGQGLVDNSVPTGAAPPESPPSKPLAAAEARIAGRPAGIKFLGLAPGMVGVSQMNLVVPDVDAGEQLLEVSIGGVAADPSFLSVKAR